MTEDGQRTDAKGQRDINGRGKAGRRKPVGGEPRLHSRRVGISEDERESQESGGRTWLQAQFACPGNGLGRSRIIGLVVAYLNNQFYPEALEKLSKRLQERRYHVLVFMTAKTQGDVSDVIEEILDYQVDGIIAASVALSSELSDRCRSEQVPLVLFNRSQDDPDLACVTSDNYAGGRRVAEFLVAGGHRRIAYIAGWEGASTQRDREAGFIDGLAASGQQLFARGVGNFEAEAAAQQRARCFQTVKSRTPCSWRTIIWRSR